MNINRKFCIKGVGKYLPKTEVNNSELETQLNLPAGWIYSNIGVKTRHKALDETNSEMGAFALKNALENASISIHDIDCLIGASATFDYLLPNGGALIKNEFHEANELDFPCVDIDTTCTSFVTALDYATLLIATGNYKNIAIVSSEKSLLGLNPDNPETYSLFGDAAAAVIISPSQSESKHFRFQQKTFSKEAKSTLIEGGGNNKHPKFFPYNPELYSFKMDGKRLLKLANEELPKFIENFFSQSPIKLEELDWIVPHQASKLGIRMLKKINNNNSANIIDQLENHGNCIAASIPLTLVNGILENKIKEGDSCFLIGTAAGMTISGLIFNYTTK